ncbi:MAG: NAD(P)/FAD-dependent oxidoreductase [Thermomicrobiales bacterium]|nr:NAD(P)/FAD-dependent oxidoreductase [Thermomicrobiales bacterium]
MSAMPSSMPQADYDVIVVGARCAGSPTAMLLARAGYRVLVLDRAVFPSDSIRAHFVRGVGVACLERWGLLDRVAATGCPPIHTLRVDLGDFPLPMPFGLRECVDAGYAPRRFVLDTILVEAAAAAGAEVRDRFSVQELLYEDGRVIGIRGTQRGGRAVMERARVVVGADGLHSVVARSVATPAYDIHPTLTCCYFGYFGDVPQDAVGVAYHADRFAALLPTNAGLSLVAVAAPIAEFPAFRADPERAFFSSLAGIPWMAEHVRPNRRAEHFRGTGDLPNMFRKPYGPGWALVGDAGYHRDPIPAHGISDAFRDAELLARAIDAGLSGSRLLDDALADYERRRNEAARPTYEEAVSRAEFRPFPPEAYAQRAALVAA